MRSLLHFDASRRFRDRLAALEALEVAVVEPADEAGFAREIATADILLHVLAPVTDAMIRAAPRLRLIQKIGVGVNTIDRAAAARAGIPVANMPGTNTAAVVEHTLALMLATLRRLARFDAATRRGQGWGLPADEAEALGELCGRTVGLVGFGAVAQRLAPVLQALGAETRYWSRSPEPASPFTFLPLPELLATSDIVSLHLPLTTATRRLVDREALAQLKAGAILVNTARGELVDSEALADALASGRLAGAGLDVFEVEPATDLGRLATFPSVVMTPHIAWLTPETLERSLAVIEENARRLAEARPILHEVPWDGA